MSRDKVMVRVKSKYFMDLVIFFLSYYRKYYTVKRAPSLILDALLLIIYEPVNLLISNGQFHRTETHHVGNPVAVRRWRAELYT